MPREHREPSQTLASVISPMMAMAKLKRREIWGIAVQHNLREKLPRRAHHINESASHLNTVLRGAITAAELRSTVAARVAGICRKPRKDAVWAIEVLFSLHPNHSVSEERYFSACVEWIETWCGGRENVISAVIHRDEGAPHCHVLVLPIINGRMQGSKLVGHPPVLKRRQRDFRERVANAFGLVEWRSSAEILTQGTRASQEDEGALTRARRSTKPMLCRVCGRQDRAADANDTANILGSVQEQCSVVRTRAENLAKLLAAGDAESAQCEVRSILRGVEAVQAALVRRRPAVTSI